MSHALKEKIKVVKLTTNQTVRIPTSLVKALKLKCGTDFFVHAEEENIILTPLVKIPKSQAYFWTKEWQAAERRADDDIKRGRVKTFKSMKDLIAALDL